MKRSSVTVGLAYEPERVSMTLLDQQAESYCYQFPGISHAVEQLQMILREKKVQRFDVAVGLEDGLLTRVVISCQVKLRRAEVKKVVKAKLKSMFNKSVDAICYGYTVVHEQIVVYVIRRDVVDEIQNLIVNLPLRRKRCLPCERIWQCLPKSFHRPAAVAIRSSSHSYYCDTDESGIATTGVIHDQQYTQSEGMNPVGSRVLLQADCAQLEKDGVAVLSDLSVNKKTIKLKEGYEMSNLLAVAALR